MTTPARPRPATETLVMRRLREGYSAGQVADFLGLTKDQVVAIAQRVNGATAARAAGVPADTPITELPVRVLCEHPDNVRDDLGDLSEITASVQSQGILQPLLVTRLDDRYVVIAGHRRLAAARAAGLTRVPVMLRSRLQGTDAVEAMLVENLQRKTLDPVEEAQAYASLLEQGRTQAAIAAAVGVPQGRVSQRLALLNLTPAELAAVRRKEITVDAGYKAGRERGPRRMRGPQYRPKPRRVPHFTREHPLASAVAASCGHETTLKLGVGCGACWEKAIRDDAVGAFIANHRRSA